MIDAPNKTNSPPTALAGYRARLEKRLLRHLTAAAKQNRQRFVRPSLEGMQSALGCPDAHMVKRALLGLVMAEKLTMSEATTASGEIVRGFTVLLPEARNKAVSSDLKTTLEDERFLHDCGISVQ